MKLLLRLIGPIGLFFFFALCLRAPKALASYDPRTVPNNKVGVHILEPSEISKAADLVNNNGGDWGYVTVPIQPTDRDKAKWQDFMHAARDRHLIPIVRITTVPLGGTWNRGEDTDLVDFANFLNGLDWPVENRYIILFNEVNRSAEWGGNVAPATYAAIVKNAATIFKERSADFFMLGPALDDALPDSSSSMSALKYLRAMAKADPMVFTYFDGWAAHSYPNPGFAAAPRSTGSPGILSYKYFFSALRLAAKPVFVTETGWDQSAVTGSRLETYWKTAWNLWNSDSNVVAVTPFVLSGGDQFSALSLISGGNWSASGQVIANLSKSKGEPRLASPAPSPQPNTIPELPDWSTPLFKASQSLVKLENIFRLLVGLPEKQTVRLGGHLLTVEVMTTPRQWEKGLSGRDSLDEDAGMLFRFPYAHVPIFWMKDMKFPLDMIWINDNRVVDISANVPLPSGSNLPTYSPRSPVNTVLEVNAGWASAHNVAIGAQLSDQ